MRGRRYARGCGLGANEARVTEKNLLIGGHTVCRRILTVDDGLRILACKRSIAALVAPARSLAARREKCGVAPDLARARHSREATARSKERSSAMATPSEAETCIPPPPRPGCDCRECARDRPPNFLPPPSRLVSSLAAPRGPTLKILPLRPSPSRPPQWCATPWDTTITPRTVPAVSSAAR